MRNSTNNRLGVKKRIKNKDPHFQKERAKGFGTEIRLF